jgi:hypothetical protein
MSTLAKTAAILILILTAGIIASAQSTTTTQCAGYGNQVNCTSNTNTIAPQPDNSAQQAEQRRENYEAGQALGSALGTALGKAVATHRASALAAKTQKRAEERQVEAEENIAMSVAYCRAYPSGDVSLVNSVYPCRDALARVAAVCAVKQYSFCKALSVAIPQMPDYTEPKQAPVSQPTQADLNKTYCAHNQTDNFCKPKQ